MVWESVLIPSHLGKGAACEIIDFGLTASRSRLKALSS